MTKQREPLTYHRTLTTIAALIGWDRCGAICGVTERAIRYWSDPDCETEIRMIDAERLDRAYVEHGGNHHPFHQLFTLRLDIAARASSDTAQELAIIAATAAKEAGEAVAALIEASNKAGCVRTRRRTRQEVEEAIGSLTDGLATLDRAEGGSTK